LFGASFFLLVTHWIAGAAFVALIGQIAGARALVVTGAVWLAIGIGVAGANTLGCSLTINLADLVLLLAVDDGELLPIAIDEAVLFAGSASANASAHETGIEHLIEEPIERIGTPQPHLLA